MYAYTTCMYIHAGTPYFCRAAPLLCDCHVFAYTYLCKCIHNYIYTRVCVYVIMYKHKYIPVSYMCIYMQALPISVERRPWHAISTFGRCSISTRSAVLRRLLVSWQIKTYMYMYKYLKIYVCIYIYICVCVYIYLHMCWEDFWWVKIHICV